MIKSRWFSKFCFLQVSFLTLGLSCSNFSAAADSVTSETLSDDGRSLVSIPSTPTTNPDPSAPQTRRELTYEDLLDYFIGPGAGDAYLAGLNPNMAPTTLPAPSAVAPTDSTTHAEQ